MYNISRYTYNQAKKLNVIVRPSKLKNKKIDVFNQYGVKLASVGDRRYLDYPGFIKKYGKHYADYRRLLYKLRHSKDRKVKNSPGYFADRLLW